MVKSVRMPAWDGMKKTYLEFGIRFSAFAYYHGWKKAIGTTKDPDLPDVQGDTDDASLTDAVKKALQRNATSMANYTMAMPGDKMGIVHKSKSTDWPYGQAWKIRKELEAQFANKTLP
jgi:hypothetical protein